MPVCMRIIADCVNVRACAMDSSYTAETEWMNYPEMEEHRERMCFRVRVDVSHTTYTRLSGKQASYDSLQLRQVYQIMY